MSQIPAATNSPKARVGLLIGVNLLWLPLSMLFNSLQSLVLPLYVQPYTRQVNQATILGFVLFAGLAAGAVVQPLVGVISDRLQRVGWLGRRTPFILLGTLLTLALLAGFVAAHTLWTLALAYIGVNIAAGIAQAGAQGLLPDLIPARQRGSAAGLKSLLELSGSVVGFSVAGMLIKQGRPAGIAVAIGLLLAFGALLTLAFVRERKATPMADAAEITTPVTSPAPSPVSGLTQLAAQESAQENTHAGTSDTRDQRMTWVRLLLSRMLFLLAVYGIGHFLLYFVRARLHLSAASGAATTSGLFTLLTLVTGLVGLGGGIVSDRLGRIPTLWVAGASSVVGVLLLVPATSLPMMYLGGTIMSIGSGLFASANWALAADLAPLGKGGRFFGMLALATGAAAALAGLLGPLVDHFGYSALFIVAALFFACSVATLPQTSSISSQSVSAPAGAQ